MDQVSQIATALDLGLDAISAKQTVTFQLYERIQFSGDGFIFFVATSRFTTVSGSLHYSTDRIQGLDETIAQNTVILSAESEIAGFNDVAPNTIWIGSWPVASPPATPPGAPPTLRIAFSRRGNYFDQAKVWHYSGFAVFPAFDTLFVETAADLPTSLIVNNSLPVWLYWNTVGNQRIPVYPSFLVPANVVPPYIVAHIDPAGTRSLQAAPLIKYTQRVVSTVGTGTALYEFDYDQLARDEVDLIMYGLNAQQAALYYANLITGSQSNWFGFSSPMPAIVDEKRTQAEIAAIAQKKSLHISVNYFAHAMNVLAYRLIERAYTNLLLPSHGYNLGGESEVYFSASGTLTSN